jgi:transcriptional regulator with PAS, ATPase and Fis domain
MRGRNQMKIGVISPYPEFTSLVIKTAEHMNISIGVHQGALQSGLKYAKKLIEEEKVNAIIARAPTADFIDEHVDIPIIKINVTNFDLMKTFQHAKEYSNKIVFIDHIDHEKLYDIPFIEEVLNIQIIVRRYYNEKDISEHIHSVASEQIADVIVGTAQCLTKTAINRGIKSFVVNSSNEAVKDALERAKETSIIYGKEKLRQKHLETIISYAFDGVIATNEDGQVSVFNEIASKISGIKVQDITGKILKKTQHPLLKKLYGDGTAANKKVISFSNYSYVVNRIPVDPQQECMVITFQETNKLIQLNSQLRSELYNRRFYAKYSFSDIISKSKIMEDTIELAKNYSHSDSNILIYGESGTGKELFAQSIHNESRRKSEPFIAINCAALPESLLESELFGYEEGAFTGAKKGGKLGLFEMAHEGTLFLDEIGELPISLQARLLRVLQEKEVMRIGGERIIPVNVRCIAATNRDLKQMIHENNFRKDLYYRLNILQMKLPALRERREDILLLLDHLLQKHVEEKVTVDNELLDTISIYDWPGNVRELENVVERIIATGQTSSPTIKQLILQDQMMYKRVQPQTIEVQVGTLKEMEVQLIEQLCMLYDGNKQELAEALGVSRTTLWKKIKELETDMYPT